MNTYDITSFQGTYRWLSNFWPVEVQYNGIICPTVEHAYQAAKAISFVNASNIARQPTPGDAKRAGRRVITRTDWEEVKEIIMLDLLRQKFQHQNMKEALLATGKCKLIEGNTWNDHYWGVCGGEGKNRLGLLLMQVREELQKGEVTK